MSEAPWPATACSVPPDPATASAAHATASPAWHHSDGLGFTTPGQAGAQQGATAAATAPLSEHTSPQRLLAARWGWGGCSLGCSGWGCGLGCSGWGCGLGCSGWGCGLGCSGRGCGLGYSGWGCSLTPSHMPGCYCRVATASSPSHMPGCCYVIIP